MSRLVDIGACRLDFRIAGSAMREAKIIGPLRQSMRNTFVAVDAGFMTGEQEALMRGRSALALLRDIHRFCTVAIAAFKRVVGFQAPPFVLGQGQAHVEKLLARANGAEDVAPYLFRCLNLAANFVGPIVWHVTVGAGRPHAGSIGIVDRRFQFRKNVFSHLVTADAKFLSVRYLQSGIEPAPKEDAGQESSDRQEP